MNAFVDSFPNDIAVPALKSRYTDAYLVARAVVLLGNTIKTVGIALGVLIFIGVFGLASYAGQSAPRGDVGGGAFVMIMFIGGANALFIGFILYLLGVLVSAQGQILKAALDSAVNGSPFLTNEHRAEIMSLTGKHKTSLGAKNNKVCEICGKELSWVNKIDSFGAARCKEHLYTQK